MAFKYKDGEFQAEGLAISKIAEKIPTPFYLYSKSKLEENFKIFEQALSSFKLKTTICFAVKANSNLAVLSIFAKLGAGADTVSEGEIRRALKAGIPASKIVFSGVGKTINEMEFAIKNNISQFNVESPEELEILNQVAASLNTKANVALRVNPNVDASTHEKITTGRKCDKFGIDGDFIFDVYEKSKTLKNINIVGITCHIGSQITNLKPYSEAFAKVAAMVKELKAKGHNIQRVDLGGGVGINYNDNDVIDPKDYAAVINEHFGAMGVDIIIEPGRILVGEAGILVSEVQFIKHTTEKNFIVIDAAMNDLIRPAMYGAYHEIIPVIEAVPQGEYDIVGPVCESSDIMGKNRQMPELKKGDLVTILSAGAYGAVMSCNYNTRPLVAEVLISGDKFEVIRKKETYEEIFAKEQIPDWA